MDTDYWEDRWATGDTPWQLEQVNPLLQRFLPDLQVASGSRVLVPLCGQSLDMLWLRDQGYQVVGIELSEQSIRGFLEHHDLQAEKASFDWGIRYALPGLDLLHADIFALDAVQVGPVDLIWDRAALVALPQAMRADYIRQLMALTPTRPPLLCWTLEYEQQQVAGPPFSVWLDEVERLLGRDAAVTTLLHRDSLARSPGFREAGVSALQERLWLAQWRDR
ncbi:MAG: thiopurine S-methyltransferase [Natronospirillum sp.]|uniref:thiopurine S-methyltransferase n=1 Tax=Natronospirillum sp. TaxID=2812955 RepID=UPI0025D17464|nr:thiopurine S-methyltransferase [Natronospirillum sp.]MCH8550370.1 thiopurine S-methyltransferase [Natronospirillum sp.]